MRIHYSPSFRKPFFGIMLIVLALLAGCAVKIAAGSQSGVCESTFTEGDSFNNRCAMEVTTGTMSVSLAFSAHLDEGSLRWTLTDPEGNIVWEDETGSGAPVSKVQNIDKPEPGTWNLALKLTNAKGEYRGEWIEQ